MEGLFFIGIPISIIVLWFLLTNLDSNYKDNNDKGPPDDNC